jgi:hypothetical protein
MRKMILLAAILLPATLLLAQSDLKPLDVKTGEWQVTMTMTLNGMGAPRTTTYRSCVKKEELGKYPFTDPDKRCSYKVVSSTGKTMEAHGTCRPGSEEGKVDFDLRLDALDSENVKGTGDMTMNFNGQTMTGKYAATAKWLNVACSTQ